MSHFTTDVYVSPSHCVRDGVTQAVRTVHRSSIMLIVRRAVPCSIVALVVVWCLQQPRTASAVHATAGVGVGLSDVAMSTHLAAVPTPRWPPDFSATLWLGGGGSNSSLSSFTNGTLSGEPVHVLFSSSIRGMRYTVGNGTTPTQVFSCIGIAEVPLRFLVTTNNGCQVHRTVSGCDFPTSYLDSFLLTRFLNSSVPWLYTGVVNVATHNGTVVACHSWRAGGTLNATIAATLKYFQLAQAASPSPVRIEYWMANRRVGVVNVTAFTVLNASAINATAAFSPPAACANTTALVSPPVHSPASHLRKQRLPLQVSPSTGSHVPTGVDVVGSCTEAGSKFAEIFSEINGDGYAECLDAALDATEECFAITAVLAETGGPEVACSALGAALAVQCTAVGLTRAITGAALAKMIDGWCQNISCPPCVHGTCVPGSPFCRCPNKRTGPRPNAAAKEEEAWLADDFVAPERFALERM